MLHLVCRETLQKSGFGPVPGNGTTGKADLLEGSIRQEQNTPASQLIHDRGHDRQTAFSCTGRLGGGQKGRTTIIPRRRPDTQILRQAAAVGKARPDTMPIACEAAGIDPKLFRHVGDHCGGRDLARAQDPAWKAHHAKLDCITELIMRPPTSLGL